MLVTTSPAALKGRSTTRGIEAPPEVGRRLGFPGCRARGGWPLLKEPASRSLKPLHHMSKIRISEEFTTSSTDFIRVATLEELKTEGMIVVRGARCPLLVVYDDGKVFALDNRCLILDFRSIAARSRIGILTCHWHHARFDLASGCTFDLWADDAPTAAVELRDGVVWVCPHTRYTDGSAHWRNRLREGLEQNIGLVIAKAVLGLIGEGVDYRALVRDAVLFGARNRDGWGIGLTILTALAKLIPFVPEEETYLALYKGISRVARDCDGAAPRRGPAYRWRHVNFSPCRCWSVGSATGRVFAIAMRRSAHY